MVLRLLILSLLFLPSLARADAITPPLLVSSKYFDILASPKTDIIKFLNDIRYDYFLQSDTLLSHDAQDPKIVLAETVDALLMECARIIGIHVYSFKATMELLPDENTLKIVIKQMTGMDVDEKAFYLDEDKVILITLDQVRVGVLGHEMTHALICHYFGAPPAANIQEILAGYVDFTLSKNSNAPLSNKELNQ